MNLKKLVVRLLTWGTVAFVLLVGARYAHAVFGKYGFSSALAWNPQVAAHAISESARSDWRNLSRLLPGSSQKMSSAEMQNENSGEMRVPISRDALRMLPVAPANTAVEEFQTEKGVLTLAREAGVASVAAADLSAKGEDATADRRDWILPAGNDQSQRRSPLSQIDTSNVGTLKLKYAVDVGAMFGGEWKGSAQASPMEWGGLLFWLTPDERLMAVDAVTGKPVWNARVPRYGLSRRGFLIHPSDDGLEATVYVPFGKFIAAFDARTGKLNKKTLGNGVREIEGGTVIGPAIAGDVLLVALYTQRSIVALDLASGEQRWEIKLHGDSPNFDGGTQWGGMTVDRATQTLFVTTGNPRPALIGVTRPGPNKNTDSILAIDLSRHEIKWAFQEVAHDLWDLDVPGAPILTTLEIDGKRYDVVTSVTKMGNTLLLDRATGKPIHDFRRRRAPGSRMANDVMPEYQPDVELPVPLISLQWEPTRITQVSAERRASVESQFSEVGTISGRFRPPELNKDLVTFGVHGGAEWHGASVDPDGIVYVPVNDIPWMLRVYLQGDPQAAGDAPVYQAQCASCHLPSRNGQFESVGEAARRYVPSLHGFTLLDENKEQFTLAHFQKRPAHAKVSATQADLDAVWKEFFALDDALFSSGKASMLYHWRQLLDRDSMPGSAPPWGKLAAVNLATGLKVWEVPLGDKTIDGTPQATGSPNYGGLLGTAGGLLFVVGTDDKQLRAIDKKTGATLWKYGMDAAGSAPPISFEVDGRQYVAVISSGGRFHNFVDRANKLYVFGL